MNKPGKSAIEMRKWLMDIFGCKDLRYLPDRVLESVLANNTAVYDEYIKEYPDLEKDSLKEFFESYFADRAFLAQDFTPDDVATLMAELTGAAQILEKDPEILDEAAGIGTLIIPVWRNNPDVTVYARELSATTVPFLLFNLALRNVQGVVVCGDTLSLETFAVYTLSKGERYSKVKEFDYYGELGKVSAFGLLNLIYAYMPKNVGKLTVNEFDLNKLIRGTDPIFIMKALRKFCPERFGDKEPEGKPDNQQIGFLDGGKSG